MMDESRVPPNKIFSSTATGGLAQYEATISERRAARAAAETSGHAGPQAIGLHGTWLIQTEMSSYVIDRDAATLQRVPGQGVGMDPELPGIAWVETLRKDGEIVPLLGIDVCVVGERAMLLIDVRGDGFPTSRHTSVVRAITELTGVSTAD
jgi:hypothetical protein